MADTFLPLSDGFPSADESQWLEAVSKALKGGSVDKLTRITPEGLAIKPLYREADWPSSSNPLGAPGEAPFLRGGEARRDAFLPWDIRQIFAHPDPAQTNKEILRDLERGVSGIELMIDPTGHSGCAIYDLASLEQALDGINASIAPVALAQNSAAGGYGLDTAMLLAGWAEKQETPEALKLAFNLSPLASFARLGTLEESLESAFERAAALAKHLAKAFPHASLLRIDARPVHETGAGDAQELAALIAEGIDTLRRLDAAGLPPEEVASKLLFTLSVDANYGRSIAKLRAARRLWARCLEALGLPAMPMQLQAVSSQRMLTRRDPWVNLLRNTAACFAAGVGGADIVTVNPFTDALGLAEELGRRTARNTQIIAQEESGLGRVADAAGGAWFIESYGDTLAKNVWGLFQEIEAGGGYGAALIDGAFQTRIADTRKTMRKDIARRKIPVTGVSEFAQLKETPAPVADVSGWSGGSETFHADPPVTLPDAQGEAFASPLLPMRLAAPFEHLRDHADARAATTGKTPAIFLATLGPLAEHNARADFTANLFAAGGIEAKRAPVPPENTGDLMAAFKASGCALAVLCGSDARYADEAAEAAIALKRAGVQRLYLAGKPGEHEATWREAGIDSYVHIGVDVIATLELAHAELGISV